MPRTEHGERVWLVTYELVDEWCALDGTLSPAGYPLTFALGGFRVHRVPATVAGKVLNTASYRGACGSAWAATLDGAAAQAVVEAAVRLWLSVETGPLTSLPDAYAAAAAVCT